jgi:hypothetical protein
MEAVEASATARVNSEKDRVRLKKKTLQSVVDQCQRALELLATTSGGDDDEEEEEEDDGDGANFCAESRGEGSGSLQSDREADKVWNLGFSMCYYGQFSCCFCLMDERKPGMKIAHWI